MLVKENMSAREGKHERSCGNFFYGASSASGDFMCRIMMQNRQQATQMPVAAVCMNQAKPNWLNKMAPMASGMT